MVDRDTRPALANVMRLGLGERVELVSADVGGWLARQRGCSGFDLVFVDAPYRLAKRVGPELDSHLPRLLAQGARAIVECAAARPLRLDSLGCVRQRRYGATEVSFYAGVRDERSQRHRRLPGKL